MSIVVSNVAEVAALTKILKTTNLFLRLYSNDVIPGETDTAVTFTQVTGGGYAVKTLIAASWVIVSGAPSTGTYAQQTFTFTGVTDAPGSIYGYYVINTLGILQWAERFTAGLFTPIAGSTIKITPVFSAS